MDYTFFDIPCIVNLFLFTFTKISKKDCDDEDECGSADDIFINEGRGNEISKGHSPSKDKVRRLYNTIACCECALNKMKC